MKLSILGGAIERHALASYIHLDHLQHCIKEEDTHVARRNLNRFGPDVRKKKAPLKNANNKRFDSGDYYKNKSLGVGAKSKPNPPPEK